MMAVVHDLAEALAGDITPHDGISNEDKHTLERDSLSTMLRELEGGGEELSSAAKEILGLWEEYEQGMSPEAIAVKDLDKFEMILQADEYEQGEYIGLPNSQLSMMLIAKCSSRS